MGKRTVELTYSRSAKLNKGNYEQDAPMFSQKAIYEINGEPFSEAEEYSRLRGIVDKQVDDYVLQAKSDLTSQRVRVKDGKKYPSVTSILSPDPIKMDQELLKLYGTRGTAIHNVIYKWLETGKWEKPEGYIGKLSWDDIPYQKFFEKHKDRIDFMGYRKEVEVFNEDYLYSGSIDLLSVMVDGKLTLVDLKTGSWNMSQLVAYWNAVKDMEQVAVFDLKKGVIKICDNPKGAEWEKFLIARGAFQARFGL